MSYDYGQSSSLFMVIYLTVLVIDLAIAIGVYVVTAFAFMSFFRKVGVEPWIAWVPYYSTWKWLEVGGQAGWLSLLGLVPYGGIATLVFLGIGMNRIGIAFRKPGAAYVVLGILLPFVWAFILGGKNEVYQPELITQAGFPPPRAGYGAVPRTGF
jgi:hypothetical protein